MTTTESSIQTEVFVDLIGPILDISKIALFHDIPKVRYLNEGDIIRILSKESGHEWKSKDIFDHIINACNSKSCTPGKAGGLKTANRSKRFEYVSRL
jgi:hypothetical protein